jgi:hypothetical protein
MHRAAEFGLAAHWLYKGGNCISQGYDSATLILVGDGQFVHLDTCLAKGITEGRPLLTERNNL